MTKTSDISDKAKPPAVFGLYGAGGFAREVMPFVVEYLSTLMGETPDQAYQTTFIETNAQKPEVNGHPLVSEEAFFKLGCSDRFFNVAIGDSKIREKIAKRCMEKGGKPLSVISPHALIYEKNDIGVGAILCAHTVITSNVTIGRFFHSNIYSYVAHDCVIGDYVTFAPNVHCNGTVHIHDHAYIGTGALIKQGTASKPLVIGEGAIVGMGAVVTRDVAPFSTVVGNPAKPHNES